MFLVILSSIFECFWCNSWCKIVSLYNVDISIFIALHNSAIECEFHNVIGLTSFAVETLQPEKEIETFGTETKDQSSETENL